MQGIARQKGTSGMSKPSFPSETPWLLRFQQGNWKGENPTASPPFFISQAHHLKSRGAINTGRFKDRKKLGFPAPNFPQNQLCSQFKGLHWAAPNYSSHLTRRGPPPERILLESSRYLSSPFSRSTPALPISICQNPIYLWKLSSNHCSPWIHPWSPQQEAGAHLL